jgi:hypothetical protein
MRHFLRLLASLPAMLAQLAVSLLCRQPPIPHHPIPSPSPPRAVPPWVQATAEELHGPRKQLRILTTTSYSTARGDDRRIRQGGGQHRGQLRCFRRGAGRRGRACRRRGGRRGGGRGGRGDRGSEGEAGGRWVTRQPLLPTPIWTFAARLQAEGRNIMSWLVAVPRFRRRNKPDDAATPARPCLICRCFINTEADDGVFRVLQSAGILSSAPLPSTTLTSASSALRTPRPRAVPRRTASRSVCFFLVRHSVLGDRCNLSHADPDYQSSTSPTAPPSAPPPSSGPFSNKPPTALRQGRLPVNDCSQCLFRIRLKCFLLARMASIEGGRSYRRGEGSWLVHWEHEAHNTS